MASTQGSVLVVEDDEATRAFLCDQLAADGYRVAGAGGVAEALRALEVRRPDVVLLDLILSDGHGLAVLDRVRAADGGASRIDPDTPVVVLSGRVGEADRIRGLTRGADDYVCKPFSYAELAARLGSVLRRSAGRRMRGLLRVGELTVDPATRSVRLEGESIQLSAKEFGLLYALASDPTRVHPKGELLRDVWGYLASGSTRTIDTHACRLRRKLSGSGRDFVVNVRGVGYRLTEAA
jgi:DNA-binding response OmpR family regulator